MNGAPVSGSPDFAATHLPGILEGTMESDAHTCGSGPNGGRSGSTGLVRQ